jgi:hypothetical protein
MFAFGRVFKRQPFLFLLDPEIKRARRYQNYLSLLSLSFGHLNPSLENRITSPRNHAYPLKDELIDTDFAGGGGAKSPGSVEGMRSKDFRGRTSQQIAGLPKREFGCVH